MGGHDQNPHPMPSGSGRKCRSGTPHPGKESHEALLKEGTALVHTATRRRPASHVHLEPCNSRRCRLGLRGFEGRTRMATGTAM